jgi:hypothetical protein
LINKIGGRLGPALLDLELEDAPGAVERSDLKLAADQGIPFADSGQPISKFCRRHCGRCGFSGVDGDKAEGRSDDGESEERFHE